MKSVAQMAEGAQMVKASESSPPGGLSTESVQSAVIRARYEPDVAGVNRYRHYSRPLVPLAPAPHESSGHSRINGAESIDRKLRPVSPRSPRARSPIMTAMVVMGKQKEMDGHTKGGTLSRTNSSGSTVALPAIAGAKCANGSCQTVTKVASGEGVPMVDTWRVKRPKRPPSQARLNAGDEVAPIQTASNGTKSNNSASVLPVISPQIHSLASMIEAALSPTTLPSSSPTRRQQNTLARHRFIPPPSPTPPKQIIGAGRSEVQGPESGVGDKKIEQERSDKDEGRFYFPKIILKRTGFDLVNDDLRVEEKKRMEPEERSKPLVPTTIPNGFLPQSPSTHFKQPVDVRKKKKKETSCQTDDQSQQHEPVVASISSSATSTSPTSISDGKQLGPEKTTPKATQTEPSRFFDTKFFMLNGQDGNLEGMEQRTALMEIIDNALSEAIDTQSRERTNQMIASTARKQAQAWRDVKEFMSTVLLPCSIDLANRARSAGISYARIASIELP